MDETIILASTPELEITIEIIPLTANTTWVIIDAKEDHIIKKDKATADAVLAQARHVLARKDSSLILVMNPVRSPNLLAVINAA